MNCVAFAISGQKNSLEAAMRYQKANEILPKELVELIPVSYTHLGDSAGGGLALALCMYAKDQDVYKRQARWRRTVI